MKLYFSDFFEVDESVIEEYGAFNISLLTDLPLFIDPFLLFNSDKEDYQNLHKQIIDYVEYLRNLSLGGGVATGIVKSLYRFPEIRQNWLGYSMQGNGGRGLGPKFANALNRNLNRVFTDFGSEQVTKSSHLEKLTLIEPGVGRDSISDFTTNLIHGYLLEYTQEFARLNIQPRFIQSRRISKAVFSYKTHSWVEKTYELPVHDGSHVLLTPMDILTKDETWISRSDLIRQFDSIPLAISNEELRAKISHYFNSVLPPKPTSKETNEAKGKTIDKFPQIMDYYILEKEESGDEAQSISKAKVGDSQQLYINQFRQLPQLLSQNTAFYNALGDTKQESYMRVIFLKQVIENNDGYKMLWLDGKPISREADLHILYRLTWFATVSDVNHEANNGRGATDYTASRGSSDKSIIEFKLASNSHLKDNLAKQTDVYASANQTDKKIIVIMYFTEREYQNVIRILRELNMSDDKDVVLIDSRADNKPSASTIRI